MFNKNRRILWLLNHDTLSKFELPLIKDLGFEIFTPKVVPEEILEWSGSITYEYDSTLTIPMDDLEKLNKFDFYRDEIDFEISRIMNKYFETTLCMFNIELFKNLIHNFEGKVFLRAFGIDKDRSYSSTINQYLKKVNIYKLEQIKNRFWFSECYDNLSLNEDNFIKERAIYMPLGLPKEFYNMENQWTGTDNRILFFCSRINSSPPYKKIYKKFIKDFSQFDYVIAGNQPIEVNDDKVLGFLERDELDKLYKECRVMYYHSTEPRHVHYHPLEAMIAGMPVVYMKGSLLERLGGERQSGCAVNINEAKEKIKRIFNGDIELIKRIKEDQKQILYKFSYEFNKDIWEKNFIPMLSIDEKNKIKKNERNIAIFLPNNLDNQYISFYLETVINLAKIIREKSENAQIVLGVESNVFEEISFDRIKENRISVRKFDFLEKSINEVSYINTYSHLDKKLLNDKYIIPEDKIKNFMECDYWIFMDLALKESIAPIKPYIMYINNILERNYTSITETQISNLKNAEFIITDNEYTQDDLIKFLGIKDYNVKQIPQVSEINIDILRNRNEQEYVLFILDIKNSKKNMRLLKNLKKVFEIVKVPIEIIFNNTFDYMEKDKLKEFIETNKLLTSNIKILYELEQLEYYYKCYYANKIIVPYLIKSINIDSIITKSLEKKIIVEENEFNGRMRKLHKNITCIENISKKDVLIRLLNLEYDFDKSNYFNDKYKN